ncbi:hypothetical protein ACFVMC_32795 [Nocardia sp. NPDC127579]|uniref:hypothetical protein n=1 Tax=Nocardia sp. NPDC127579 TaxID=3345402 RepID=UPI003634B4B3
MTTPAAWLREIWTRATTPTAEVQRLRSELRTMQVLIDDMSDRESMYINSPRMETLTTAAAMTRLGTPRARRRETATESTVAGATA